MPWDKVGGWAAVGRSYILGTEEEGERTELMMALGSGFGEAHGN